MRLRIDYGNGQVSRAFSNYPEAKAELLALKQQPYSEFFRIQRYIGEGEWEQLGARGRLATESRRGVQ